MTASKTSSTEAIQQTAFKELVAQYANLSPLNGARQGNVRCPFHDDHTPSLSVNLDECVFKCHGCHVKGGLTQFRRLVKQHRLQNGHRGGEGGEVIPPSTKVKSLKPPGLTLADLAAAKKLPEAFLRSLGVHDAAYYNPPAVSIVYRDVDGNEQAIRYRLAVTGPERFKWRRGARPTFYGLDRHREIKNAGWLLLVEGESDCWSAWHHEIPAVGVPGKESWPACWSRCPSEIRDLLAKVRVFLWQERDATHLPRIVGETLPDLRVIQPPRDIKDVSDLHLRARDKTALVVEHLKRKALTLEAWQQRAETAAEKTRRHEAAAKAKALAQEAKAVLEARDPLTLVASELRRQQYGGDLRLPLLAYLAVTSRLLKLDKAAMLVHLLLLSPPGAGKNYILKLLRSLFPSDCWSEIPSASPKVLIYDEDEIRHKAVVYAEVDSVPSREQEDNPAASAVRSLLQDGELRYKVVVPDPEMGGHRVRSIYRPGPAVLITTSTRKLPPQMDSRVFTLDVPDDPKQIKAALKAQAVTELDGRPEPDAPLVAFQGYLQAKAPWSVVVPFAHALRSELVRNNPMLGPRVNRDFSRLLSLNKSATILRHRRRARDARGRLKATIGGDYRLVYALLNKFYEATATGASEAIRKVVKTVATLRASSSRPVTLSALAKRLERSVTTVSAHVQRAMAGGWLVNEGDEWRYALKLGEPMPSHSGLPSPEDLARRFKALRSNQGGSKTPPLPPASPTRNGGGR